MTGAQNGQELLELFDVIDSDGSGSIESDELLEMMMTGDLGIDRKEAIVLFKAADENNDGEISRREWAAVIKNYLKNK